MQRWVRKVRIWQQLVAQTPPPEDAALRLLEKAEATAADLLEFQPIGRYVVPNGIEIVIQDLRPDFEGTPAHVIGELTRRFETMALEAGKSSYMFLMRFRHLEAEVKARLPANPEYCRVLK